jgi:hypothetical protein
LAEQSVSQDLYDRLTVINKEAFDAVLFDTAYHALVGALHSARNLEADQPLIDVARRAKMQLSEIDQKHPDYEHSTRSASGRQHDSIFLVLSRQAEAILQMRRVNRMRGDRP